VTKPPLKVDLAAARARNGVINVTIIAGAVEIDFVFAPRTAGQFAAFLAESLGRLADPPKAGDHD